MNSLAKFFALPLREKCDVAEATLSLTVAQSLLLVPFRWLVRFFGRLHPGAGVTLAALDAGEKSSAFAVRHAILRASRGLPWNSTCLVRALAAQMMLRRRHLPSVLQFGVRSGAAIELSAHAWLRCGDMDIVGAETRAEYTPIAALHA